MRNGCLMVDECQKKKKKKSSMLAGGGVKEWGGPKGTPLFFFHLFFWQDLPSRSLSRRVRKGLAEVEMLLEYEKNHGGKTLRVKSCSRETFTLDLFFPTFSTRKKLQPWTTASFRKNIASIYNKKKEEKTGRGLYALLKQFGCIE